MLSRKLSITGKDNGIKGMAGPALVLPFRQWNFRLHFEQQPAALQALYREVGFARSLRAYELPDGRLKLIDGHLRRDMDPEMEVDVEVLDVGDEEARAAVEHRSAGVKTRPTCPPAPDLPDSRHIRS
jgi:hypothetical protein